MGVRAERIPRLQKKAAPIGAAINHVTPFLVAGARHSRGYAGALEWC